MKPVILCVLFLVVSRCPVFAQAPAPQDKLRLERADELRIVGEQKAEIYLFSGNVRLRQGLSRLFCQRGQFATATQFALLQDSVYIEDVGRQLYGDRMDYDGNIKEAWVDGHARLNTSDHVLQANWMHYKRIEEQAEARGNVHLVDFVQHTTLCGGFAFYDRLKGFGRITDAPMLTHVDSTGRDTLRVWGRLMEAWADSQRVEITDSVRIVQGDMRAQCQKAYYWAESGRLLLIDTPIVWQESQQLRADTIDVNIGQSKLSSGRLLGHAEVLSTDTSNTGTMTGSIIVFQLPTDSTRYVQVTGQATSTYHVPDTEDTPGENTFTGDEIEMYFKRKKLIRMRVLSTPGLSTGTFKPQPRPPKVVKEEAVSDSNQTTGR